MYRLVLYVGEDEDNYFKVLHPHDDRTLKKEELLVYQSSRKTEFREKMREYIGAFIRMDGEVENYVN